MQTKTVDFANISGWSPLCHPHPSSSTFSLRRKLHNNADPENIATIFEDSIWTYVEPHAGVVSACLPFLANVFGQRLLKALKNVSSFASRTLASLRLHSRTDHSTKETNTLKSGTQRARHEAYELRDDTHGGLPEFRDRYISQESVRHLV